MDFLIDLVVWLVGDVFIDGGSEIVSNRKISKWIRLPVAIVLILLFVVIVLGVLLLGIFFIDKNILVAVLLIIAGFLLLAASIVKSRKLFTGLKNK